MVFQRRRRGRSGVAIEDGREAQSRVVDTGMGRDRERCGYLLIVAILPAYPTYLEVDLSDAAMKRAWGWRLHWIFGGVWESLDCLGRDKSPPFGFLSRIVSPLASLACHRQYRISKPLGVEK